MAVAHLINVLGIGVYMSKLKRLINSFIEEEDGMGVVEVVLIIVVLIGLVLLFKGSITEIINGIFDTITDRVSEV